MRRKLNVAAATLTVGALAAGVAFAASTPTVTTDAATNITGASAVLHGKVNPDGSSTTYYFQWGPTNTYGFQGVSHSAGKGTKDEDINSPAKVLTPGTVYHFRVVAFNHFGMAVGRDRTFKTTGHPPAVVTTGPTFGVGHAWAVVTGTINPEGETTQWAFQYGTSTAYGSETEPFGTLAAAEVAEPVNMRIDALSDGTTFHYRLVAIHGSTIVSYGGDEAFTTLPFPKPKPRVSATTTPHRTSHKPYLFTTTGTITLPSSIPAAAGCNGTVAVRFFVGNKSRALRLATVQPNCTFSVGTLFHRRIDKRSMRLRVEIRFHGNPYLASESARVQRVRLG